jgi:hypothetical protein
LPTGWHLLTTAFNKSNDYFGAAYWNFERQQIVIAHRGTDLKVLKGVWTDLLGIVLNKFEKQMNSASTFAEKVYSAIRTVRLNLNQHFQLFFTGHSLAQITTFTIKYLRFYNNMEKSSTFQNYQEEEEYNAHTVVFDSPGCKEMISKI